MNPYLAFPLGLVVEYGPAAALAGLAYYLLVPAEKRHAVNYWARQKLDPYLVVAAVFAALGYRSNRVVLERPSARPDTMGFGLGRLSDELLAT
jgi:hypothetical protein